MNFPNQFAVRSDDVHPIVFFSAPSCARPEISFSIASDPIAPPGSHVIKRPSIAETDTVNDIEDINVMGLARFFCRVDNLESLEIRREANSVRLLDILVGDSRLASGGIEPVRSCWKFEGLMFTLVPGHDAVSRVGEPNIPVRMNHHIIWRIQALALKPIHQDCNCAVRFRSRHLSPLAGDQAPLDVTRVAVAVIGRIAETAKESIKGA